MKRCVSILNNNIHISHILKFLLCYMCNVYLFGIVALTKSLNSIFELLT